VIPSDPHVCTFALLRLISEGKPERMYSDAVYATVRAWIEGAGSAVAALHEIAREPSLIVPAGALALDAVERIAAELQRGSQLVEIWRANGYDLATICDETYPEYLQQVTDAPPLLFGQGVALPSMLPGVAVVGTRQATDAGKRRAHKAARELAAAGIPVYSGMAAGIDTAAHIGALEAGGFTVAVMGTPITRRYPSENAALAERILSSGGALVTEFLPDASTRPWHFLRRNKTMSGLSMVTLVIEAGMTSGAKAQATAALKHGRAVYFPRSLVESQPWAAAMVETGLHGERALMVERIEDLVAQLVGAQAVAPEPVTVAF
jgi:DNA processing protein